jgi:hypothetical protein
MGGLTLGRSKKKQQMIYQTDVYLAGQNERLMMMIQERAIGQYFGSFSRARLSKAAEVFGWPAEILEQRLVQSIRAGHLAAKLDLDQDLLLAHRPSVRADLLRQLPSSANQILLDSNAALLRLHLIAQDLAVRDTHSSASASSSSANLLFPPPPPASSASSETPDRSQ